MTWVLFLSEDEVELRFDDVDLPGVPRIAERVNFEHDGSALSGKVEDVHWNLIDGTIWMEVVDVEGWGDASGERPCPICDHVDGHHDMYAHAADEVAHGAGGS